MSNDRAKIPAPQSATEVDAFLARIAALPKNRPTEARGRLIFALDATASRQPTWDQAAQLQGEMFREAAGLGGLELQLCFYRGFGEFKVSPWLTRSEPLLRMMTSVFCLAGRTQLGKVLRHAINETRKQPITALVFIGDCFEEDIDAVGGLAGELGILGVRCFMFHEGSDPFAAFAFKQVAHLTQGAYCSFDSASGEKLKGLLRAVAAFVAGGMPALEYMAARTGGEIKQIAYQLRKA